MGAGRDHGCLATGVLDHEAYRVGAEPDIERDGDEPRAHRSEEGFDEFEPVRHGKQNAVSRGKPAPRERGGDTLHPRVQLAMDKLHRRRPRQIDDRDPVGVGSRRGPVEITQIGVTPVSHQA